MHFNGPQTKFIRDSLYKHPVNCWKGIEKKNRKGSVDTGQDRQWPKPDLFIDQLSYQNMKHQNLILL